MTDHQSGAASARLKLLAEELKAQGLPLRRIAFRLVNERLKLQGDSRLAMKLDVCDIVEDRNRARFGQPAGPTPMQLYESLGKWESVIDAACQMTDEEHK